MEREHTDEESGQKGSNGNRRSTESFPLVDEPENDLDETDTLEKAIVETEEKQSELLERKEKSSRNIPKSRRGIQRETLELKIDKSDKNQKQPFQHRPQEESVSKEEYKIDIKTIQHIQTEAEESLRSHQEKKSDTERKISALSSKDDKSTQKHKEAEKEALTAKLEELNQQQGEFQMCLSKIINDVELRIGKSIDQEEFNALMNRFEVESTRLRQALPIFAKRSQIMDTILQSQVSIILGETGSGKSTQITQYILESSLSSAGKIVCTQPRKVAAASLAERVASELLKSRRTRWISGRNEIYAQQEH